MHYTFDDRQVRLVLPHRTPMLLVDWVPDCAPALDRLQAVKQVSVGDSMFSRGPDDRSFFPPTLVMEALAQSCGFLMNLRWLAAQGVDVAAFAGGDDRIVAATSIPHSVLAEVRAHQLRLAHAGDSLRMEARVRLQRGQMVRFSATAASATGTCTEVDMLLAFPEYTLSGVPGSTHEGADP